MSMVTWIRLVVPQEQKIKGDIIEVFKMIKGFLE